MIGNHFSFGFINRITITYTFSFNWKHILNTESIDWKCKIPLFWIEHLLVLFNCFLDFIMTWDLGELVQIVRDFERSKIYTGKFLCERRSKNEQKCIYYSKKIQFPKFPRVNFKYREIFILNLCKGIMELKKFPLQILKTKKKSVFKIWHGEMFELDFFALVNKIFPLVGSSLSQKCPITK